MAAKKQPPLELTPKQRRFVRTRISTGNYDSGVEVVDRAFGLLASHESDMRRLRQKIDVGMRQAKAGHLIDGELVFERLLSRARRGTRRSA